MKVNGEMIWLMEKAELFMMMVIIMREIGWMIKVKDLLNSRKWYRYICSL